MQQKRRTRVAPLVTAPPRALREKAGPTRTTHIRCLLCAFLATAHFIVLFPAECDAWGRYTHRILAKESLESVAKEWDLNAAITVTSFEQFLQKLGRVKPEIQTKEDFAKWLQINPAAPFDKPYAREIIGGITTPLQTLILYSQKADDGRDQYLTYDPFERFWFGSGTKTASQAFRHMEKPPFDLLHPLNTFGFPLGSIGQASRRAQIYFDLALTAYRLGEPYWAFNFLGCGLHYIEDLQNPYHAAQLSMPTAIEGIKSYLIWGRKQNWSWIQSVTHVASNLHHYFEGYVEHKMRESLGVGSVWIEALRTPRLHEGLNNIKTPRQLAENIRDFSNHSAYDAVTATLLLTEKKLLSERPYLTDSDNRPQAEDPDPFFTTDNEKRGQAEETIAAIVLRGFQYQGKAVRHYVKMFLDKIR